MHAGELGIDPARIGIGGVSAGAGLCSALALLVRDRGELKVQFQLLGCPTLDDTQTTPSSQLNDLIVWTRSSDEFDWRSYLGDRYGTDDIPATQLWPGLPIYRTCHPPMSRSARRQLPRRRHRLYQPTDGSRRTNRATRVPRHSSRRRVLGAYPDCPGLRRRPDPLASSPIRRARIIAAYCMSRALTVR